MKNKETKRLRDVETKWARPLARAFTMLELLVAVTATVIMVLFLNQIFSSMSGAVTAGKATSVIVENSRVIIPQLAKDAKEMVGPGENGLLVIVNRRMPAATAVRLTKESTVAMNPPPRVDQAMWVRSTSGDTPMTPSGVQWFDNATTTQYARISYGHVLRTLPDGTSPAGSNLGVANDPNDVAANWILGRQALFLFTTPPGGSVEARGGWYAAPVVGYGTTNNAPPFLVGGESPLYMGISDRAYFGFDQEAPNDPGPPVIYRGAMVGGATAPESNPNHASSPRLYTDLSSNEYLARAINYTYVTERLRINPEPQYPSPAPSTDPYEAWQIAQMHAYLADRVVDFEVAFAGDYDVVDGIDTVSVTDPTIRWYDMDFLPPSGGPKNFVVPSATVDQQPILYNPVVKGPNLDVAFFFRHGDGAVGWPYLLRFRYRLIDASGRLVGADGLPGKLFEQVVRVNRE